MAARRGTTQGETVARKEARGATESGVVGSVQEGTREAVSDGPGVNEVRLVGRVSGMPETRSLPSGDVVVQLRVVVRRPPDPVAKGASARGSSARAVGEQRARASVDTIDVSCWTPLTRRAGLRMADGDVVEVEGSLRRRFYRAGPAVQSRYDVVAERVRRATVRA